MQLEDAINESVRQLSSLTSRRGLLAKVGAGLIGATLLPLTLPQQAQAAELPMGPRKPTGSGCANCGGCGSCLCGTTNCGCCQNPCTACGSWCYGFSCTDCAQCGGCPAPYDYGWYWYCCNNHQLWECQDCCYPATGSCACSTRCNTQLAC